MKKKTKNFLQLSIRCSKWHNNRWINNFYTVEEDNACQALNRYIGEFWHDIESQIGMEKGVCPIKKGIYTSNNLYIDLNRLKIQMFLSGKFKSHVRFMRYSKPIFCKDFTILLHSK